MTESETKLPRIKRQLPPAVSWAVIVCATLIIFALVGRFTPSAPQSPYAGKPAPDFSAQKVDGGTVRLSDYKGKVILLNFWATWCGPCKMEMPDLVALQKKYAGKNFTVLGLSDDDSADRALAFIKEHGINYPNGMTTPEIKNLFGGVPGLPTSILIDRNGKIVRVMEGINPSESVEALWSAEIDKIL